VARRDTRPLGYEQRITMRQFTDRALSNVLFQRLVIDSLKVTEPDMRALYATLDQELHLRIIVTADRGTAERVRAQLVAGTIDWKQAFERYSIEDDPSLRAKLGDVGWVNRFAMTADNDADIMRLAPGGYSQVYEDVAGYHVMQCVERRKVTPAPFEGLGTPIAGWLRSRQLQVRVARLQKQLGDQIGLRYDSTNVAWASSQFQPVRTTTVSASGAASITYNTTLPNFTPSDTARVLARWKDGQLTLSRFLQEYSELNPFKRPAVNTHDAFQDQINSIVLEPYRAAMARSLGLDRDPIAVAMIDKRYEQFLVERMYRDSVESRIQITPQQRRKYYDDHRAGFITYSAATYAVINADSKAYADSIVARLKGGEKAEAILRADSLRTGKSAGAISVEHENDHATYHRLVFEEMKPGQTEIRGPDRGGRYFVVQLISFDPGRQLSYEEAQGMADDNLRAIEAEKKLNQLYERHRKGLAIKMHPELVMRVMLVSPDLLVN